MLDLQHGEKSLTSREQYRGLLEVAEAIAAHRDLGALFDDLAQRLPRIVPFDRGPRQCRVDQPGGPVGHDPDGIMGWWAPPTGTPNCAGPPADP